MKGKRKTLMMLVIVLTFMLIPITSQKMANAGPVSVSDTKGVKNGWVITGGHRYYYRNGKPVTGWQFLDGMRFYFNKKGQTVSGWLYLDGHKYYLNKYGRALTGFQQIGSHRYFFHKKWGFALTGWNFIDGYRFYFNKEGQTTKGWLSRDGHKYYMNNYGRALTGFQKIGNYRYYFHTKWGYAYTGWHTINGHKYYFESSGRAATGTRTFNGIRYTFNGYGRVLSSTDPVVYRAVVIGESNYPGTSSDLSACAYDARGMATMCKKTGYTTANYYLNASSSKILSSINSTFAAANSNDVSLFYYTGHGSSDGSLVTTSYEYISPYTLAYWLKQVSGNVVVVLDSCYSGAAIGKNASNLKEFNNNIIEAFDDAELEVKSSDAKSGPMSTSKFKVLTACGQYEYSYASDYSSRFTYYLVRGTGYDYSGYKLSSIYADSNSDKKLSLKECYNYTYKNCISYPAQHVRCYPENSSFKLFQR